MIKDQLDVHVRSKKCDKVNKTEKLKAETRLKIRIIDSKTMVIILITVIFDVVMIIDQHAAQRIKNVHGKILNRSIKLDFNHLHYVN